MTPANTSFQIIVLWVAALGSLLSFGTAIWTVFSGPSRKNAARLDEFTIKMEAVVMRLTAVETAQATLPTKSDIHKLELAMVGLEGKMGTVSQSLEGHFEIMRRLEAIVTRHDEHLLRK